MNKIYWVYIAGALRGNFFKKMINISRARNYALMLWENNIAAFCPHINSGWIDSPSTDGFILPANINILLRCDAILVIPKWQNSKGTIEEIKMAYLNSIPIYFNWKNLIQDCKRGQLIPPEIMLRDKLMEDFK